MNVLILNADPSAQELIQAALETSHPDAVCVCISSMTELNDRLESGDWPFKLVIANNELAGVSLEKILPKMTNHGVSTDTVLVCAREPMGAQGMWESFFEVIGFVHFRTDPNTLKAALTPHIKRMAKAA